MENFISRIMRSRSSLILSFVVLFVFLSGLLLAGYLAFGRNTIFQVDADIINKNEDIVILAAQMYEKNVEKLFALADIYVSGSQFQSHVRDKNWQAAIDSVKPILKESSIDKIFLVDAKGVAQRDFPADRSLWGKDFSYRDWYQGVTKKKQSYLSEIYRRASKPQVNVTTFAFPVLDDKNQIQAILGLQVRADILWKWLDDLGFYSNGKRIFSVDQRGRVVSHKDYNGKDEIADLSFESDVKSILQGKSGSKVITNKNGQEFLSSYVAIPQYGRGIVARIPIDEITRSGAGTVSTGFSDNFVLVLVIVSNFVISFLFWLLLRELMRNRAYA